MAFSLQAGFPDMFQGESMAWLDARSPWAPMYVLLRYGMTQNGIMGVGVLGLAALALWGPRWWFEGGRTAWVVAARLAAASTTAVELLVWRTYGLRHMWDVMNPAFVMLATMPRLNMTMMLPWPTQAYVVAAEAVLYTFNGLLRHRFSPPPGWARDLLLGVAVSSAVCLGVPHMEYACAAWLSRHLAAARAEAGRVAARPGRLLRHLHAGAAMLRWLLWRPELALAAVHLAMLVALHAGGPTHRCVEQCRAEG